MANTEQSPTREAAENIAQGLAKIGGKIKYKIDDYDKQIKNSLSDKNKDKEEINSLIDSHNQICDALDSINNWLLDYEDKPQKKGNMVVGPITKSWEKIKKLQ